MERKTLTKDQKPPVRNNHVHRNAVDSHDLRLPGLQRSIGNHAVQRLIQSPYIQAKLQVSRPGDQFEQEADRVADTVMRMPEPKPATENDTPQVQAKPLATRITPLVQRAPEEPSEENEEEDEVLARKSKSHGVPLAVREDDEDEVVSLQRACVDCEEEAPLQRMCDECEAEQVVSPKIQAGTNSGSQHSARTGVGGSHQVLHRTASGIHALNGGGNPLPASSRAFFEPRFGTDFSHVRVHTDSQAASIARSINARAFTVGPNIAFGAGQYAPELANGRHLLAHELTHVVQQSPHSSADRIHRDAEPQKPKGPKELLEDRLEDYEIDPNDQNRTSEDKAETRRVGLLLQAEIDLHNDPAYTAQVTQQFPDLENYVTDTLNTIHPIGQSEDNTIDELIKLKGLTLSTKDFYTHPFFAKNMSAFPKAFLELITPQIKPPYDEGTQVVADTGRATQNLDLTRKELPDFFFEQGLPVSRQRSMSLSYYELIKANNLKTVTTKLVSQRPRFKSDVEFVIEPEETNLHEAFLAMYESGWTGKAINLFNSVVFTRWVGSFNSLRRSIEDGNIEAIDPAALHSFKQKYPTGLTSLDDLFNYSASGGGAAGLQDANPFAFFDVMRTVAVLSAAQETSQFIEAERRRFQSQLSSADAKVQGLSDTQRLGKALDWSVKKGFAAEAIMAVVDNFTKIVTDILKEKVKRSVFRRIVSIVASLHPLGRLAALAYEAYKTLQDVKDALDIISLVNMTIATIDEARSAISVAGVQRAAARLSEVYEQVIPIIVQKISSSLAKKLMKGSKKEPAPDQPKQKPAPDEPKQKKLPDEPKRAKPVKQQERDKMLEESKKVQTVDKLTREPKYLHAELGSASEGSLKKSTHPDYEVETTLPNGHTWRRNSKGMWCRFTPPSCILSIKGQQEATRKLLEDLDKRAEEYKQAAGTDVAMSQQELDALSKTTSDNPPGFKKPKAKTALGTFMHSRDYTRFCAWLDTAPGLDWLKKNNVRRIDLALQNMPTGPRIDREFEIKHPTLKPRIDVVDWENGAVHEIKPRGMELQGFAESQQYAEYMNKYHKLPGDRQWRAGHTIAYDGQKIFDLFTKFGYFEPESKTKKGSE